MITASRHTRRKGEATCCDCGLPIRPGDSYHSLVFVGETDLVDDAFVRWTWHDSCGNDRLRTWWHSASARPRERSARAFDYIAEFYGVRYRRGQRAQTTSPPIRFGTVAGGDGAYVLVRLDGERHAHPWHPTSLSVPTAPPSPTSTPPG